MAGGLNLEGPHGPFPQYEGQAEMWYVWCDPDTNAIDPPANPYVKGKGIILPTPTKNNPRG
jgi:hypothetical protein